MITLRAALAVLAAFACVVAWWTWSATRGTEADGRERIVFWADIGQMGEETYSLIHRFEQLHPQYRVEMGSAVARDLTGDAQRLLTAIAGGVPPDLVFFDRFAVAQWADRGALTDLKPYLDAQAKGVSDRLDLGEYYPWTVDEASYRKPGTQGPAGVYAIPCSADIRLLWTNLGLLRQEGLVDPATGTSRPPRTWEELRAYCKRLTRFRHDDDPSSGLARLGFAPSFGNAWLYIYAFEAGGSLLSADGLRTTMDAPPVVRALRFMADCYDDIGGVKQADAFQSGFQSGPLDPFFRSQVAMKIDGSWCLDSFAAYAPADLDWTVSPAPIPADRLAAGAQPITWAGGFSYVIPATARCKQGAFALMRYLRSWDSVRLQEQSKRELAESQGHPYIPGIQPNRAHYRRLVAEAVAGDLAKQPRFRDAVLTFQDMLDHTLIRPVSPVGQLLFNKHAEATENAVHHHFRDEAKAAGKDEIAYTLAEAQRPVQAALDQVVTPRTGATVSWSPFIAILALALAAMLGAVLARARARRGHSLRETGAGLLFAAPWLLGFAVFCGGSIMFSLVASVTDYDVLNPARFCGLANYRELIHDPLFWQSLDNTVFMLIRIPLVMAVGLALALLLDRSMRGIGLYRTAFYVPVVMPAVAASLLWLYAFNPTEGLLSRAVNWAFDSAPGHLLEGIIAWLTGKPCYLQAPAWISDPHWSKPSYMLMNLWTAGGSMIIWLAGLQAIPRQLYEAAAIDGAGSWRRFWHITLPMLSPYILFNLITGVIGTMQIFTEAYIMSDNGKPENSLLFYALYLFDQSFQYFRIGYASALAWILFVIVLLLTLLQLWSSRRWVHYEHV